MNKQEIFDRLFKSNLPSRAISVGQYLLYRANADLTCYPSVKTMSKDLGMATRTIDRAIIDLIDAGFITKESRYRENGGQSSNLFAFISLEAPTPSEDTISESKTKEILENQNEPKISDITNVSKPNTTIDHSKNLDYSDEFRGLFCGEIYNWRGGHVTYVPP